MSVLVKSEPLLPVVVAHIKAIASERNLALSYIADLAGVARSHFWEVIAGRRSPTLQWVERVASALDLDATSLFSPLPLANAPFTMVAPKPTERFRSAVPLLSLRVAASGFGEQPLQDASEWVVPRQKRQLKQGMFVAKVVGRSMEPLIPDGAFCLFQAPPQGPLAGKIVLAQHRSVADPETGGSYTIKRFRAKKIGVDLVPANTAFPTIELRGKAAEQVSVVAEMVAVL